MAHVRATHVSLAKASHMSMTNFKYSEKGSSNDHSYSHCYSVHSFTKTIRLSVFTYVISTFVGSFGFHNNFSEIVTYKFSILTTDREFSWYIILHKVKHLHLIYVHVYLCILKAHRKRGRELESAHCQL